MISSAIIVDFEVPTEFNRFLVQEYIPLGQRVKEFTLEAFQNNEWKEIAAQTTIGRKRILRLPNTIATKIRLNILDSKACPVISNLGVFKAEKVLVEPSVQRNQDGMVSINAFDTGVDIYYTVDRCMPATNSNKYAEPFILNEKATIKAIVVDNQTGKTSPVSTVEFDVSKKNWKVVGEFVSVEDAKFVFDGDINTAWNINKQTPIEFIFDLGDNFKLKGVKYLPGQGRWDPGIISKYELFVSNNGKDWGAPVSKGEFSNIKNSPVWQEKTFRVISGRYVRFKALSTVDKDDKVGIAEFDVITVDTE